MELAVSHGKDHTDRHKHGAYPVGSHFTGNDREKEKGIFPEPAGKRAEKPLLYKPIHDGVQAALKKPAERLSCRKCRVVGIQHFCTVTICAGLFVDHHADLLSGPVFTDGVPGA